MTSIQAKNLQLGVGVEIHPSAVIRGINGPAENITIGDHTYIGADVQIICNDFSIGDYGKIHHHTNIHGYNPCHIGHNAWIGQYTLIDSIGGVEIGDNCGVGAHSQLWSHIKFGDTLEGCRFNSDKGLKLGNDVWLVGHCILSPIAAADKSMALAGSVVTKDMAPNTVYAGTPAQAISDKIGGQFEEKSLEEKWRQLTDYLMQSGISSEKIRIVKTRSEVDFENSELSFFCLEDRKYTKRRSAAEIGFIKFLLPEKAKFTPY